MYVERNTFIFILTCTFIWLSYYIKEGLGLLFTYWRVHCEASLRTPCDTQISSSLGCGWVLICGDVIIDRMWGGQRPRDCETTTRWTHSEDTSPANKRFLQHLWVRETRGGSISFVHPAALTAVGPGVRAGSCSVTELHYSSCDLSFTLHCARCSSPSRR